MLNLQDLPQEILSDIFTRNQDPCGVFAEKMKLVSKKCREVVINRQMDLVDVYSVEIFVKALEMDSESNNGSIEAIVRFGDEQETDCKSWTKTLNVEYSTNGEIIKKLLDIVLVNKVKSLKHLELHGVNITPELLEQIHRSGVALKNINTIVMNECEFCATTEELHNFLKMCNLKNIEMKNGKFKQELITDELLSLPTDKVSISSDEIITTPQITNDILPKMIEQDQHIHHFEIKNMRTAIDLEELIPIIENIGTRHEISVLQWSFGVFDFYPVNEMALLRMQRNFVWETNIVDDNGMRKYTMSIANDFNMNEIQRDCQIIFWMQTAKE